MERVVYGVNTIKVNGHEKAKSSKGDDAKPLVYSRKVMTAGLPNAD
jgi:hypothetical protein